MRELTKSQYDYLRNVLGVEAVIASASHVAPSSTASERPVKARIALISAPLSKDEKDLLSKITTAFGWSEFETILADKNLQPSNVEQLFIFGDEAKKFADIHLQSDEVILAPSLGVLLEDAQAKKILWQQMKNFMESK